MSEIITTTPVKTTAATKAAAKKRFKLRLDLQHSLKRAAFDPIYQLTTNVFPLLEPKDRAKVIIELLPYLYAQVETAESKKRGKGINVNTQVNLPQPTISEESLRALRELASSKGDE